MGATTQEAINGWLEVCEEVAEKWSPLIDDESFLDLPPDTTELILAASNAFADVRDQLREDIKVNVFVRDPEEEDAT